MDPSLDWICHLGRNQTRNHSSFPLREKVERKWRVLMATRAFKDYMYML